MYRVHLYVSTDEVNWVLHFGHCITGKKFGGYSVQIYFIDEANGAKKSEIT